MTYNLLALSDWPDGLFTFLLGIAVVFVGMIIIVLFVSLVGKAMSNPSDEPKEVKQTVEVVPVQQTAPTPVVDDGEVPEHVRVAIIAAIAMYYENNNNQPKHEFTVRKIKKLRN
ncbi:MAG: OadG family protein [Clostridia bacterium]|nr:OadG family protein [Clostridia bacterium]